MRRGLSLAAILIGAIFQGYASEAPLSVYIQVIVGANSNAPPTSTARIVGPRLHRALSPVFRWEQYWEVKWIESAIQAAGPSKVQLDKERRLEIELKDGKIESRLYRHGQLVRRRLDKPKKDLMAVMGGTQAGDNAWFLVIRTEKPSLVER